MSVILLLLMIERRGGDNLKEAAEVNKSGSGSGSTGRSEYTRKDLKICRKKTAELWRLLCMRRRMLGGT